jgi:hypothetical protein
MISGCEKVANKLPLSSFTWAFTHFEEEHGGKPSPITSLTANLLKGYHQSLNSPSPLKGTHLYAALRSLLSRFANTNTHFILQILVFDAEVQ